MMAVMFERIVLLCWFAMISSIAADPIPKDTCMTKWLKQAGIPLSKLNTYENNLRVVGQDQRTIANTPAEVLKFYFQMNLPHAKLTKQCITGSKQNCLLYNPCGESGSCRLDADQNRHVCNCSEGLSGVFCEEDCNECLGECDLSHNCHSQWGVCNNTRGSFQCACKTGFSGDGKQCLDINECTDTPCSLHATCANTQGSYRCTCKPGFEGKGHACTEICNCCTKPCLNGATCKEGINNYTCLCDVGYEGRNCETKWLEADHHKSLPEAVSNLTSIVKQLVADFDTLKSQQQEMQRQWTVHSKPSSCFLWKSKNPEAVSGVFMIQPTSWGPPFHSFCNFTDDDIAWTRILRIGSEPYSVTSDAFGNITSTNIQESAKLSDAQINAIAKLGRSRGPGRTYYRLTSDDTTKNLYIQTDRYFSDGSRGWNLFAGRYKRCISLSFATCSWVTIMHTQVTLDVVFCKSKTRKCKRLVADDPYFSSGQFRCNNPPSTQRCITLDNLSGDPRFRMIRNAELWIGNL